MSLNDTIYSRGFLSKEIDAFRNRCRSTNAELFAICEARSDAATDRLFKADVSQMNGIDHQHRLLAIGFWCRSLRACQGAILLLERGMIPEAQTLIRSAYEFLFYGAASIDDLSVIASLKEGDAYARREQAVAMLRDGTKHEAITAGQADLLNTIIADMGSAKKAISAYDAAEKAGLVYLYSTVYRGMSLVGSHATLAATNSVFQVAEDESSLQIVFGPLEDDLDFCMGLIVKCLETGIARFDSLLSSTPTVSAKNG